MNRRNILVVVLTLVIGSVLSEQEYYKQSNQGNNLNIDHVLSLWNKTVVPTEQVTETVTTEATKQTDVPDKIRPKFEPQYQRKPTILETFSDGFKYCIRLHEKLHSLAPENKQDQNVIVKCFKTELIHNLNRLVVNADSSIKLFNGYIELQKLPEQKWRKDEPSMSAIVHNRKIYSSKVSNKKLEPNSGDTFVPVPLKISRINKNHDNEYYENYQKLLRELVARKNGNSRQKRSYDNSTRKEESNAETLQKTARLFENGKKLFGEISRSLQNEEEDIENLTETILDPDLLGSLNRFTRQFALKVNLYPGVAAKMMRSRSDGVTFDLELNDSDDDDGDDDDDDDDEGREDYYRKKYKKKKVKISKKTLKKLFPYLLIPFMIQAALLPLVLKFLLFVAIKALIAGKLALVLVAFNVLKHGGNRSDDDEYAERMASAHYGYNNGDEEYGAWINGRRNLVLPTIERARKNDDDEDGNDPYKGYKSNETS